MSYLNQIFFLSFRNSLYMLVINLSSYIPSAAVFSHSSDCFSTFLIVFFDSQKFLILMKSSLSLFPFFCCLYLRCPVQFGSVAQSFPTLCDPMNLSTPGLPVHHQLLKFTQTHVHRVGDAIQPSHPLSSPFPPAPSPSQHQGFFQ